MSDIPKKVIPDRLLGINAGCNHTDGFYFGCEPCWLALYGSVKVYEDRDHIHLGRYRQIEDAVQDAVTILSNLDDIYKKEDFNRAVTVISELISLYAKLDTLLDGSKQ